MSVSLEYLTRCSVETGYRVEPLEKVVRLGELAGDIARHPCDHEEARRVAGHPAVQWKIESARGHVSKGGKKRRGPNTSQ